MAEQVDNSNVTNAEKNKSKIIPKGFQRQDVRALWIGIGVSLIFTLIIWITGETFLNRPAFGPDTGASWYYWQTPPEQVTLAIRLSVWISYILHQVFLWGIIFYSQKKIKRFSTNLRKENYIALTGNAFFIGLHYLQTILFYDGLAIDVSIWSSQVSVIILLLFTIIMESRRRGIFFGKKVPIQKRIVDFVKKYHGYYIAWAMVYTFWYHSMENTFGHLFGFFYMFLFFLQSGLMYTKIHINRYWIITQEVIVLFHGTAVALMNENGLWQMFFFGFLGMFAITQLWGLRLNKWVSWSIVGLYGLFAILVFSGLLGVQNISLWQPFAIPLIEYAGVFFFVGLFWLGLKAADKIKGEEIVIRTVG